MEFSQEDKSAFLIGTPEREDLGMWAADLDELPRARQVFRLVWELESEVNNGGFQQYAFNGSGECAPLCEGSLIEIGAAKTASIVAEALATIGANTPWKDWDARQAYVTGLGDACLARLEELDQAFFRYEDNLTELLFNHILKNLQDFPPSKD